MQRLVHTRCLVYVASAMKSPVSWEPRVYRHGSWALWTKPREMRWSWRHLFPAAASALAEAVDGLVESPGVHDAVRVVGRVAGRRLQVHDLVQVGVEVGSGDVEVVEVQLVRGGEL